MGHDSRKSLVSRIISLGSQKRAEKRRNAQWPRVEPGDFAKSSYVRSPKIWHFPRSGVEVLVSADGSSSMEKGKESKSKALKNRLRELLKIEAYEACLRGGGGLSERNKIKREFFWTEPTSSTKLAFPR